MSESLGINAKEEGFDYVKLTEKLWHHAIKGDILSPLDYTEDDGRPTVGGKSEKSDGRASESHQVYIHD
jgi:hypothetical protein